MKLFNFTIIFMLLFTTLTSCEKGDVAGSTESLPDTTPDEETTPSAPEWSAAWESFNSGDADNILVDFSYAGYKRGEVAPPDVQDLGYKYYDITQYGAVAGDGLSDREAIERAVGAIVTAGSGVLYIPEGVFDIHTEQDEESSILIVGGNIILKGAGRDLSFLRMSDTMEPATSELYSSPPAIEIKHQSTISQLTTIEGDAPKGSFSVEVGSTAGIAAGDWICLYLKDNSPERIEQQLGSDYYKDINSSYDIVQNGLQAYMYHQVKSISGQQLTLYEPLMHAIESSWNWAVYSYPHYEGVGVEDITFVGNAKEDFLHHGSADDDGGYKPINLTRLVNSWMRRVRFQSVSEASSITSCANVSIYDVIIEGENGHSAIRSQASSRIFLGGIIDTAGQYHAVGVSKQSIGTVVWRNRWSSTESCFESHALQPRATLFDSCSGALLEGYQGGDYQQGPSHMEDLTLWNFEATAVSNTTPFKWWDNSSGWKFLRPIIVGYHGALATFSSEQLLYEESTSQSVLPESLYEAQLEKRLGSLPIWVYELRATINQ